MMKKTAILILSVLLIACGGKKKKEIVIPSNILPQDKMVKVMTGLQIVEASMDLKLINDNKKDKHPKEYYDVFKTYHVTEAQYDSSFKYYALHPKLLNKTYEKVLNELSKICPKR